MLQIFNQLLQSGLPAAAISMLLGKDRANWQQFVGRASAAGYGLGQIAEFLTPEESVGRKALRQRIDQRRAEGTASPAELATRPAEPPRPGAVLSQLASAPLALTAASQLAGAARGNQQAPANPNASPSNAQNQLAKAMKAKKKPGPLSAAGLAEQFGAAEGLDIIDVAPTFYGQATAMLEEGSTPRDISASIRQTAKKSAQLAKELSQLRKRGGAKLEDVIAALARGQLPGGPAQQSAGSDEVSQFLTAINDLIQGAGQ